MGYFSNLSCHQENSKILHCGHTGTILEMRLNKFFKWANPGLFSFIFGLFKEAIQFLQQINVKNVHPEYGAGIRTHDLSNQNYYQ